MIIISIYLLIFNEGNKILIKNIKDIIPCPDCGGLLKYRDSKWRILKKYGGDKYSVLIRRLKCSDCPSLHTELPDCLAPYKHYEVEVIENVVDGIIDTDDIEKDYPCEATKNRWKEWISRNTKDINGYIKSIGFRLLELGVALLSSTTSILELLQNEGEGWLSIILRMIYNSGNFLPT